MRSSIRPAPADTLRPATDRPANAPRPGSPKTSVIVPVLYDEPRLAATLRGLAALRDVMDVEVLVAVDVPDPRREAGARARNDAVAAAAGAVALYRVGERGFGSALRWAFARASGDVVIPFMADGSDDPRDIPVMLRALDDGLDIVVGSRYMAGGRIVGNSAKQRLSRLYSTLVRLAGGPAVHDVSNAFKAYRRDVLESVPTHADSFDISVELTVRAHAAGMRVGEIPTVWTNRDAGASHFRMGRELGNYWRWLVMAARSRPAPAPVTA